MLLEAQRGNGCSDGGSDDGRDKRQQHIHLLGRYLHNLNQEHLQLYQQHQQEHDGRLHQQHRHCARQHRQNSRQRQKNSLQQQRQFGPGRPVPYAMRVRIVEMARAGLRQCDIGRQLRISHSTVSKILTRYHETGDVVPEPMGRKTRVTTPGVEAYVVRMKREHPLAYISQIRKCLIADGVCGKSNVPSASSIDRILCKHFYTSCGCGCGSSPTTAAAVAARHTSSSPPPPYPLQYLHDRRPTYCHTVSVPPSRPRHRWPTPHAITDILAATATARRQHPSANTHLHPGSHYAANVTSAAAVTIAGDGSGRRGVQRVSILQQLLAPRHRVSCPSSTVSAVFPSAVTPPLQSAPLLAPPAQPAPRTPTLMTPPPPPHSTMAIT